MSSTTAGSPPEVDDALDLKQEQFNAAMAAYETRPTYRIAGRVVSVVVVGLQASLLALTWPLELGWPARVLALLLAYVATDFINGLVHMWMDNNDRYTGPTGPLVAAFHLHHRTQAYKVKPLALVYFDESGSKLWLVAFLAGAAMLVGMNAASPFVAHVLTYVGILSSVAEVSHYLRHVPESRLAAALASAGLLLSKQHHCRHHAEDNVNYAFLNGVSDPLLNLIARRIYPGYKTTTDLHYARYLGPGTRNR